MKEFFTIGVDYGTNSVRSIVVNVATGKEVGSFVFNYPSGRQGILLDKNDHHLARQNPADYIKGAEVTIVSALKLARRHKGFSPDNVIGIGVDTTGSTPIPVDRDNVPLALQSKWKRNLAAHAWLWKDHTSAAEAAMITEAARTLAPRYIERYGGAYSSEWFWAKIWHCLNSAPEVFEAAYSWVELADFVPALLAGVKDPTAIVRGVCAAGHKAMFSRDWGGLPDKKFLASLDPKLAALRDRLFATAYDAGTPAGALCIEWAEKIALRAGIPIAIGAFDAHYGAIGAGVAEGTLVKIIGTSTCDCTVVSRDHKKGEIPGICGTVLGSILPDYFGVEAGQSAVGDIFKWFVEVVCGNDGSLHAAFTKQAQKLLPGQSGLIALDWNNGNRTILVDPRLTGLLVGQTLYTRPAEIYRALIEGTAFGARAIIERVKKYGVPVDRIVCCGGIAEKNPLLMQIYADVTGCTMLISGSSQTCALGSCIAAAVAAGKKNNGYDTFAEAQKRMTSLKPVSYTPNGKAKGVYDELYAIYRLLHDGFGGVTRSADLSRVMKDLIAIKERSVSMAG
ncbi:MAG: ribulokinase [Chitinispirillaceae bacterium]|jgi:L-ribulokinase